MELVSGCGDHQASSSAQGARGSPDPAGPYGEHRARGQLGKRCILSQAALGLRFVPRAQFPFQNAAPRSGLCAVSEIGHGGVPP